MVTKLMRRTKSLPWSHEYSQIRPASLRGHADGCNRAGHRSAFPRPPRRSIAWTKVAPSRPRDVAFSLRSGMPAHQRIIRVDGVDGLSICPRPGVLILCSSRKKPTSRKPHTPQTHTSTPNHPAPLLFSLLLPLLRRASRHRHT